MCLEVHVLRDLLPCGAVLVGNLRVLGGIVLDEFIPGEVADVPSIRLLTVLKVEIMSQQFQVLLLKVSTNELLLIFINFLFSLDRVLDEFV